jgi:protein TonB
VAVWVPVTVEALAPAQDSTQAAAARRSAAETARPLKRPETIQLNSPQPRYTEDARKNKIQGTVTARLLIGSDGVVKRVTITRGLPDGLDEQAIQAAYQLRFKPAMKGGQPVAYQMSVLIEFNLR